MIKKKTVRILTLPLLLVLISAPFIYPTSAHWVESTVTTGTTTRFNWHYHGSSSPDCSYDLNLLHGGYFSNASPSGFTYTRSSFQYHMSFGEVGLGYWEIMNSQTYYGNAYLGWFVPGPVSGHYEDYFLPSGGMAVTHSPYSNPVQVFFHHTGNGIACGLVTDYEVYRNS